MSSIYIRQMMYADVDRVLRAESVPARPSGCRASDRAGAGGAGGAGAELARARRPLPPPQARQAPPEPRQRRPKQPRMNAPRRLA